MKKIIKSLKEHEYQALIDLKQELIKAYPGIEVILYGSKARGDYDEFSDIDILILTESNVNKEIKSNIFDITYDIELKYNIVFGIIIRDKEFWISPIAQAMPLHWNIDREGIAL